MVQRKLVKIKIKTTADVIAIAILIGVCLCVSGKRFAAPIYKNSPEKIGRRKRRTCFGIRKSEVMTNPRRGASASKIKKSVAFLIE